MQYVLPSGIMYYITCHVYHQRVQYHISTIYPMRKSEIRRDYIKILKNIVPTHNIAEEAHALPNTPPTR